MSDQRERCPTCERRNEYRIEPGVRIRCRDPWHQQGIGPAAPAESAETFQSRVKPWMLLCFDKRIAADIIERNHRFFEEATELVQSLGMTASEAHQLVDYTYGRPIGNPVQEVGGTMVTLAALCLANGLDMHEAAEIELARISAPGVIEKIRAKQAAKPKHSPLPEYVPSVQPTPEDVELLPCPFCGGPARPRQDPHDKRIWHVQCCECDARGCGHIADDTESARPRAIEAWNTRSMVDAEIVILALRICRYLSLLMLTTIAALTVSFLHDGMPAIMAVPLCVSMLGSLMAAVSFGKIIGEVRRGRLEAGTRSAG